MKGDGFSALYSGNDQGAGIDTGLADSDNRSKV